MVEKNEEALVIAIYDSNPTQLKEQMVSDVGAMIRWYSSSDGRYQTDEGALYRWGRFLEALATSG